MAATIPPSVRALLDAYLAALSPVRPRLHGVYVHGSLALGDFAEGASDIDVVVPTRGDCTGEERARLRRIHADLAAAHPLARRLDVAYAPLPALDRRAAAAAPYPVARDGRFRPAGRGDVGAVTRWLVKHRGIPLLGPPGADLPFAVTWAEVRAAMRDNLDGYWAGKAARPYLFLSDYWVGFAVATLCRILSTLEDGEIVAKTAALADWRERLPDRWRPLLDEARRLRHDPAAPSPCRSRLVRMRETRAFAAYVRERGSADGRA